MKILETIELGKKVNYFGHEIEVPDWAEYLAVGANGDLFAYDIKPFKTKDFFVGKGDSLLAKIATVDLEGLNWEDSLVDIYENYR